MFETTTGQDVPQLVDHASLDVCGLGFFLFFLLIFFSNMVFSGSGFCRTEVGKGEDGGASGRE